jgi:hypothetical protein
LSSPDDADDELLLIAPTSCPTLAKLFVGCCFINLNIVIKRNQLFYLQLALWPSQKKVYGSTNNNTNNCLITFF